MAIRRQAPKLSPEDYEVYVEDLIPFPVDDVETACKIIGAQERMDGETAFPTSARLISLVKSQAYQRRDRAHLEEIEEWKRQWEREKSEDEAAGIKRGDAEAEMNDLLAGIVAKRSM